MADSLTSPKPKAKLGKIGGKSEAKILQHSSPDKGHHTMADNPSLPTSKARLGKIGGRSKADVVEHQQSPAISTAASPTKAGKVDAKSESEDHATSLHDEQQPTSRTTAQDSSPVLHRETSQERADKKRAQLKRELEAKSQAGTKKKRRF